MDREPKQTGLDLKQIEGLTTLDRKDICFTLLDKISEIKTPADAAVVRDALINIGFEVPYDYDHNLLHTGFVNVRKARSKEMAIEAWEEMAGVMIGNILSTYDRAAKGGVAIDVVLGSAMDLYESQLNKLAYGKFIIDHMWSDERPLL